MPKEYIEREAAIQRIRIVASGVEFDNPLEAIDTCVAVIDCEPAVDVATVRHGRWIEYMKVIIPEPYNKWEQAWKCSECGFDDGFIADHFCPNCGARMVTE